MLKPALQLAAALSDKRIGAVVIFKHGVTIEEADRLLNSARIEHARTHIEEFDPRLGYPVFYIP